ncbi:Holliday junction branch migration protein RuvA [Stackebrandtia nassauensis]|uniref:Holliday junction branch migration complex subunit RuvA n=1 Tax=Stackebrandtia nassauensis (strain DSM 44728 / CIP 108903 / NRRL B-16338 / NBRC 102104 / LLR-40K-21) TaxID=446470 RepID=D3PYQ0_STANL|nr:Holliday junction branch migration protein RuvA [Stackebrandtia nassauensis]ADD43483.1 Holliday junction DNA helicase RuvA [Stackebrandtia nassauensis DSM 44728]
MIASLTGTVTHVSTSTATITVGGVGMSVRATPGTLANLRVGGESTLYTTLVVREDSLTLYGFEAPDERDLFELLQTASGVGPRLAQAALAVHPPATVRHAIASGDTATLTRIPGVGKKGAERLVLELKDKIGALPGSMATEPKAGRPVSWRDQVQQGLMSLGWSAKDANGAITKLDSQVDGEAVDIQGLLKQAIRLLGTK